ncbi:hypothetical protein MTR67_036463 [Solanum verrucosum]|uniref:Uncharacterized protein n=1 Tax=Solanum verrucosum TaxID=315347 RepID=A0AAF0UC33_SOLVR|nr:hypothetical protein MTR67_036463 [Solanum verrucosum]
MGATGIKKSKFFVDLANYFSVEVVSSDRIQVYKGLDLVTIKI